MKTKLATLHVYEDAEQANSSLGHKDGGEWELILGQKAPDGQAGDKLTAMAHELGHFTAFVLKTPVAVRERRYAGAMEQAANDLGLPKEGRHTLWQMVPEAVVSRYHAESEAWEIARKMGVPLDEGFAEQCLDTYRAGVRHYEKEAA